MIRLSTDQLPRLSFSGMSRFMGHYAALLLTGAMQRHDGSLEFVDEEAADKPFAFHYQRYIAPKVAPFEARRIHALQRLRHNSFIGLPGIFAIIVGMIYFLGTTAHSDAKEMAVWVAIAACGAIVYWVYLPVKNYKENVKEEVYPDVFRFFGDAFMYSATSALSAHDLKPSEIIPSFTDESNEDYIKGMHKGVRLELMESRLIRETRSGKNRSRTTVFRGIFVLLDMNKHFFGKTLVKRDRGQVFNWFAKRIGSHEKVVLEDPVFEKMFEVYSSDQVEARYLLTPSFMQRLLDLSELFGGNGIQASFYEDRLLLMIPSDKNRFEIVSVFQPATFIDDIKLILEEMKLIFQIIEILKLDERTGL